MKNISAQETNVQTYINAVKLACDKIAPLWPLSSFVAVNPYLGLADIPFEEAAQVLAKAADIKMTLPTSFYKKAYEDGNILDEDIKKALVKNGKQSIEEFLNAAKSSSNIQPNKVRLFVDVATQHTSKAWESFMVDRVSAWAAAYFDENQAIWKTSPNTQPIFTAWQQDAQNDYTYNIAGLKDFRKAMKTLPSKPWEVIIHCLNELKLPKEGLDIYLHSLLLRVGGWAAYVARLDWESKLYGGKNQHLLSFLAVLLSWEVCLKKTIHENELNEEWASAKVDLVTVHVSDQSFNHKLIWQQAFDYACQRQLIEKFEKSTPKKEKRPTPKVQAVFCIDVRSEVFRRNFELVSDKVETLGFAGFFAFPIKHVPIGHQKADAQCPVLIPAGPTVLESLSNEKAQNAAIKKRTISHQVSEAWNSFKLGAISCFSFVGPVGLAYLPKLFTDAFGLTRPVAHPEKKNLSKHEQASKTIRLNVVESRHQSSGIPLADQVEMAKGALTAMSLTKDFARLVLIVGHGSSTVNNPHATGLDCGACGGHTGEANAKTAALILNNPIVREQLKKDGIVIPDDTVFVACQHDTTTDVVSIFNEDLIPSTHTNDVVELKKSLAKAGKAARTERALRLDVEKGADVDKSVFFRSKDWSQVRPEWGLAGCNACVVAPRNRTAHIDLGGSSFLHSYNWQKDKDFAVLELIMTAPMVVTSWINLQYYASTVDNEHFGSGNKTLHNVTGGIGVLEGYSGDLRVGLPWQSVHDGENYQHLPQRLNVVIEAPIEAMNRILEKHANVKALCDNEWIYLMAMNEEGKVAYRYTGNLKWETVQKLETALV